MSFWATDVERRKIKKIIAKSGLSQREYLLGAALGRTIYPVNELKPVLAELKAIGRNLNQLTVLSHQGKITSVNLTEAVDTLQKIYSAINVLYDICDGVIASGSEVSDDGDL
ncbi:MAG: plasmid mobilization relaxosome protein MobC [Clostridia bacterium]|nr:plasmid mobilization relaxosome protein MobC [Clostridia bacterium]